MSITTSPHSGSSHSAAFLRRPLKRSISATSTSSLRNSAASSHPPILPPLNLSPLDLRPGCPPLSHRTGQQLISTVFEDASSDSFVTARSESVEGEGEDAEDTVESPDAHGPSNSTILASSTMQFSSRPDLLTDPDRATEGTTLTTTQPDGSSSGLIGSGSGSGSYPGGSGSGIGTGSSSSAGVVPPARPRPRRRVPTSGGSGSSDTFIWRRWTRELSFGSALSRPSFSAARRAIASRLLPLPILLFWGGFLAPWCWLIGGWLIAEGRWEDSGKARAALPLRKPKPHGTTAAGKGKAKAKGRRGEPQLPPDSLEGDLEKGNAAAAAAPPPPQREDAGEGTGGEGGVREEAGPNPGRPRQYLAAAPRWIPFACSSSRHGAAAALGPSPDGEKVVTLVKPYSAEVWVYRCRQAAVLSAVVLLIALIVAVVVIGHSKL